MPLFLSGRYSGLGVIPALRIVGIGSFQKEGEREEPTVAGAALEDTNYHAVLMSVHSRNVVKLFEKSCEIS